MMNYSDYTFVLPFERDFDPSPSTEWMRAYWWHSVTLSVLYALGIWLGQKWMHTRDAFQLRRPLILWNASLAVFSILGCARMAPEFYDALFNHGFTYSMCNCTYAQAVTGFWTQAFALSKVVEFGDTAFIVLRKRPLIFLHYYHHVTVLMYTWHAYKDHTAAGRWFVNMNYAVHAIMYSYYTARAMGFNRVPKLVPMTITALQLSQMIMGVTIAVRSFLMQKVWGLHCEQTMDNLYFSAFIYATYALLFANFFRRAYFGKRATKAAEIPPTDLKSPAKEKAN